MLTVLRTVAVAVSVQTRLRTATVCGPLRFFLPRLRERSAVLSCMSFLLVALECASIVFAAFITGLTGFGNGSQCTTLSHTKSTAAAARVRL